MAKEYQIKCPFCGCVQKLTLSDMLGSIVNTVGMRGAKDEKVKPLSSEESLDEANWIDLKSPCTKCERKFSYNIITGESRE